ncbi:transcription/translation regulatory transformer protein RfaH [Endozoicomonas sp. SM1973]|uniref:Transcription/translation regulatory transformer protein RfaH n=1 Tax=Spartinivicinus marinus TaxID=2994442 RepID=A0A853I9G0_9GAMM|nr:transcription termination/antitermination NusG family protein [Spartinivicinus marinus]MCX4029186.1 transcription/translation regulatory transformer protein RfaH [Spartinivicinus marinus]NYZ65905.1 transcription/translation regulatory transformer protein RfaH [Spartinivicinus marinus]
MWYLLRTKPKEEKRAVQHLNNQDFENYCPWLKKKNGAEEPLFPGYLFLKKRAAEEVGTLYSKVRSTRGVLGFVRFGATFAEVDDELVEKIIKQQALLDGQPIFKPDQLVEFKDGPFKYFKAVYLCDKGLDRCVVLLNFLNQSHRLEVDQSELIGAS